MRGIKIPQQGFGLKMQGVGGGEGLMCKGGVLAGHYGTIISVHITIVSLTSGL